MTDSKYSPYCGNVNCSIMPRTVFLNDQFHCTICKWQSNFEKEFIDRYKEKWRIK